MTATFHQRRTLALRLFVFVGYCLGLFVTSTAEAQRVDSPTGKFGRAVNIRKTPLRTNSLEQYSDFPLTVEMWIKLDSEKKASFNSLASNSIGGTPRHWEIYSTAMNGLLNATVSGVNPSTIRSYVRVTDNQWHFIALTCDGQSAALFVDGRRVAHQPVTPLPTKPPVDGELFVGTETDFAAERAAVSLVDELRISQTIRPGDRVPSRRLEVDEYTVGLWRFDEASGTRRNDESPQGNSLAYSPGIDAAWTPRSSSRADAEPWERATDDDWLDDRFNQMDKGSFLGVSMSAPAVFGKRADPYAAKGLALRVGDESEATVLFDRGMLQMSAAWRNGFIDIPERRFGLIQHPEVVGRMIFTTSNRPGWSKPPSASPQAAARWSPLPSDWGHFEGLYRHEKRNILCYTVGSTRVLDMPWVARRDGLLAVSRTLHIAASSTPLRMEVFQGAPVVRKNQDGVEMAIANVPGSQHEVVAIAIRHRGEDTQLELSSSQVALVIPAREESITTKLYLWRGSKKDFDQLASLVRRDKRLDQLDQMIQGGQAQWPEPIATQLEVGDAAADEPFAVDTLTLPYDNPYKSILRVTGVGFLPDGTIAICTIYGDVWIVRGMDDAGGKLMWKRFAAGMYQPLGLAIKDGKIHVLERGQITCLHDLNNDGEADYYQNVYNGWQTSGAGHAYDTGLKLAPDGSFFFFKGQAGGKESDESGCLLRVFPDASGHEIFSTGFRHPIGLGMSPAGVVTGSDQQGNWIPSTRIDRFRKGGFYGDMRTHHRAVKPTTYDAPICWLPHYADNSAGGQVSIPDSQWGPLAGAMLHLSWGRCWIYLLMQEEVDGHYQGGAIRLPCPKLLSGPMTGAFRGEDGHLYIAGMHGWQTAAEKDGCLQRLRYTGGPLYLPVAIHVHRDRLQIRFTDPLDPDSTADVENYSVEQWNYKYSGNYGSDHWSVANPDQMGHDRVVVRSAELSDDGQSVYLQIDALQPVMQMKIQYKLKAADGAVVDGTIHNTIHTLGDRNVER